MQLISACVHSTSKPVSVVCRKLVSLVVAVLLMSGKYDVDNWKECLVL